MQSLFGQYQGYRGKLQELKKQDNYDPNSAEAMDLKNGMASTGIQSALAIGQGLGSIATTLLNSTNINDTTQYHNEINRLSRLGAEGYGSYDELFNDYSQLDSFVTPSFDEIRGMSDGQKVGAVGSSVLTGATTGLTVGGPWGAAAGAAVGLGLGLAGVFSGDQKADIEKQSLFLDGQQAYLDGKRNLDSATEGLLNWNFRNKSSRALAKGGPIERQQESIQEFANRVMKKPKLRQRNPSAGFKRDVVEGGIRIRFKR